VQLFRRLQAWLVAAPLSDPLQRRHAVALQVFCLVFVAGVGWIELSRALQGIWIPAASLINGTNIAIMCAAAVLIRSGRYPAGSTLMVGGYGLVTGLAVSLTGLSFSRDALRNLSIPLTLAALVLGRRALWSGLGLVFAALTVGFARDHHLLGGHGPLPTPVQPNGLLMPTALFFAVVTVALDRFGLSVREAFHQARERQRELEATSAELERAGRLLAREVDERQKAQARLIEAQKMEVIARLSGGVAHDFNNLLTAIVGFAELARDGLQPASPAAVDVGEIVAAANRGAALTRQLLTFARRQVLQPRVLRVEDRVRATEALLRRLLGEGIELVTRSRGEPWAARVDPGQLEQVVVNLAVNARDAMDAGGRLTLECQNCALATPLPLAVGELAAGDYVTLAVQDTGCGMDEATQRRIFEPFFTTKAEGRGTGLGLATCVDIVRQAGGAITVESRPGAGSCFRVYLPRSHAPVERLSPAQAQPVRGGSETVLVVEDDAHLRKLASRTLRDRGYRVLEATSGEEALEESQRHAGEIELLVTDLVLPRGSGQEVAASLRSRSPLARVLYVSGYSDGPPPEASEAGVPFLAKPFTPHDLARKVRAILDQPRPAP
jgi:signal transduction histidine kinase